MKEIYFIGLDVGATKIAAGAVNTKGKIVKKIILPTETFKGKKIILKNILTAADKVWLPGTKAIGIGMAGQCDFRTGVFLSGPNFPKNFKNIKIKKILEKKLGIPASLDNDAHCFTLAEGIFGAGKKYKNIIGITVGTGIGGGILINKKLYRGKNNMAGEIGHMILNVSSLAKCSCGRVGHFEALSSGRAMINFYKRFTGKTKSTFEIEKLAKAGNKKAKNVTALLSKHLGLGLANLIHLFNPDAIIVGGGLIRYKELWAPALQEAKKQVIYKSLRSTKIKRTKLGDDAGILGAALLTKELCNFLQK